MSDIIREVMPDWNGHESIVAYSIRQREERKARAIAVRLLVTATMTPAILAVVVNLTAMACDYFLPRLF